MAIRKRKQLWSDIDFYTWVDFQSKELQKKGFDSSQRVITRLLFNNIIIPNNIKIEKLIEGKIKIVRGKKKLCDF